VKTIGAFDAKTHLNQLLDRASKGETFQITRRGVPVAKLSPPDAGEEKDARNLAKSIRKLRKGVVLGKTTIRELIDAGRRY